MNSFTDKSQFNESAQSILSYSELLVEGDCIVVGDVVYELCREENCYRFFFNSDDYDYLVDNSALLSELNTFFGVDAQLVK